MQSITPICAPSMRRLRVIATILLAFFGASCGGEELQPWHTEKLTAEFSAAKLDEVRSFEDYKQLEDRLFLQLEQKVYARGEPGAAQELARYSSGSAADPRDDAPDWNRSFELPAEAAVGGVLLLHGMSDSPYSLRALAKTLSQRGYWVVALRLPGHGTAPSGLKYVRARDMIAAVQLAMAHLASSVGDKPVHMVGYSTGASLALDFALDATGETSSPVPASLVLISPAIRIHRTAALAGFKDALSVVPGLGGLAWLTVMPEFDPYKYNSFATNAGAVVHRLTRSVDERIGARARESSDAFLPPILVFKSAVDSTVTTEAVVDRLLGLLHPYRHELVLFDINRSAAKSILMVSDPGPLTQRLMADASLPFSVTFVTNENPQSRAVVARHKAPFSGGASQVERLDLKWPTGVISLSHVALPIAPDDPLYGRSPPEQEADVFLGDLAMRGERGLLNLPAEWLLRMRYNPFYSIVERGVLAWFAKAGEGSTTRGASSGR
jgi:alpha-beta hydrolase superfamily lysophospholipase